MWGCMRMWVRACVGAYVRVWNLSLYVPPGPAQGGICVGGGGISSGGLHLPAGQGPAEEKELSI